MFCTIAVVVHEGRNDFAVNSLVDSLFEYLDTVDESIALYGDFNELIPYPRAPVSILI